jgi:ADP-heptose:LPS heptosyltransferase
LFFANPARQTIFSSFAGEGPKLTCAQIKAEDYDIRSKRFRKLSMSSGRCARLAGSRDAANPVAFFVNGLGDHILSLPALRGLAQLFDGRLTLLCAEGSHQFLFNELNLRRRIAFPVTSHNGSREFNWRALTELVGSCDLFISLVPWFSDSLKNLVHDLTPLLSVGFFPSYGIDLPSNVKHASQRAFDFVRLFAPEYRFEDFAAPPLYPQVSLSAAQRIRNRLPRGVRVLAVHADTSPEKMWQRDRYVAALDIFLSRHDDFIALLVGWESQGLDTGFHADRVVPAYKLPFDLMCALVAGSDLFLGIDSCMLHLADFERIPAVGLFGPTSTEEFGFIMGPNVTLEAKGGLGMIDEHQVVLALESVVANPNQSTLWLIKHG